MADPSSSPQSLTLSTSPPPPPPPTLQSTTSEPPPPPPTHRSSSLFPFLNKPLNRPKLRVTSEFDSDSLLFLNKVSCKLFDNLAKLKLSFQNNSQREVTQPQVSLTSKYLSVLYDVEEKNTFIKSTVDVSPRLQLRALHNVNAQQGEVAMEANLAEPGYSLELSSPVPIGYPRATLKFPLGEVSIQEREEGEEEEEKYKRMLSVNGILKRQVMDGVCSALYTDEELRLRYAYKDEALSFIPTISLPSNAASFAFKRRFSPSDKLSYWYKFDSNMWSAVYKTTPSYSKKMLSSSPTSFANPFLSTSPPLSPVSPPSRSARISPPPVSASCSYTCTEDAPRLHQIPLRLTTTTANASLYEILEVPLGATSQDIKSAYRRLARICHPDVAAGTDRTSSSSSSASSADEFMKIHAAYCTLSDPEKRSVYDRRMLRRSRPLTVGNSGMGGYVGRNWETDQCW